ncbi:hypothetical protein D3C80_2001000 [compost metagenome]
MLFDIVDILVPYSIITKTSMLSFSSLKAILTPLLKFSILINSHSPSVAFLETIPTTP